MKITAGLGSIDEYIPYIEAGADEFFCGYVPYEWAARYGIGQALNRREVRYYNVQLGAMEELRILRQMMEVYKAPVYLTFNSLSYLPKQYPEIAEIIRRCMDTGFDTFIIADVALILYLRQEKIPCKIHLSGESGEMNPAMLSLFSKWDLQRIIFHRKMTPQEMKICIASMNSIVPEYEAFVLNEMCHFNGSFCNSLHCDELGHLCHQEYRLAPVFPKAVPVIQEEQWEWFDEPVIGESGCGLCALYRLRECGVTNLKLVGRGNYIEAMLEDIRALKRALFLLENADSEEWYIQEMKKQTFPQGCGKVCYYRSL